MMDKVIVLVASTVLLLSPNLITAAASSGLINGHYRSFRSIKAPKETVKNYEVIQPVILYGDEEKPYPKSMNVVFRTKTSNYTMILQMNEQLIPPSFISRYYDNKGKELISKGHVNCFYHGLVEEHPSWRVTMSTCHGFQGEFGDMKDQNNYLHLEPFNPWDGSLDQPHALYHHSEYKETQGGCGTPEQSSKNGVPFLQDQEIVQKQLVRRQAMNTLYVEWILVNDFTQYESLDRNLSQTVLRAISIANGVDELFKNEYNIRIVLIEAITWTNGDQINVVSESETLLDTLRNEYRPEITIIHDSLMLLTGIELGDSTVGIAFTGQMCSDTSSVGLTQDGGRSLTSTVSTAAHELGHIFNMGHDDDVQCTCDDPTTHCIMAAVSGEPFPTQWSSCSRDELNNGLNNLNLGQCLTNQPTMTVGDPICGNGIREGDEVCDCGSQVECTDPCCNATVCQLAANAECSAGACCSSSCQYVSMGSVCRNALGECDIMELCTGSSSDCPTDDHKIDGTPCNGDTGYCYSGSCPSHDHQCSIAFGSTVGASICYENLNTRGVDFGNCGSHSTQFLACIESNTQCGQLQCTDGDFQADVGTSVTVLTLTINSIICRSFTTQPGADTISPGLVKDGTKCGPQRVCRSQQCVNVSFVTTLSCPNGDNGLECSGNGVCPCMTIYI